LSKKKKEFEFLSKLGKNFFKKITDKNCVSNISRAFCSVFCEYNTFIITNPEKTFQFSDQSNCSKIHNKFTTCIDAKDLNLTSFVG